MCLLYWYCEVSWVYSVDYWCDDESVMNRHHYRLTDSQDVSESINLLEFYQLL